jgi:hypothetical protein
MGGSSGMLIPISSNGMKSPKYRQTHKQGITQRGNSPAKLMKKAILKRVPLINAPTLS